MRAPFQTEAMLPNFRNPSENKKEVSAAEDAAAAQSGKFVPDGAETAVIPEGMSGEATALKDLAQGVVEPEQSSAKNPEEWRQEVTAHLSRYREKRQPRAPRYPSLTLKFEPFQPESSDGPICNNSFPLQRPIQDEPQSFVVQENEPPPEIRTVSHETAKVIEFPRPWVPQARPADELAEPVIDRPRILDVPEILPPPPALGGMMIEDVPDESRERWPGLDIPLQAAPLAHRLLAGAVDGLLVTCGLAIFASVVFQITPVQLPLPQMVTVSAALLWSFWAGYDYLMTVFTGSTPGLRFAKLQLSRFDGTPASRKIRKWRALASILSAASMGLGYAWCFLDEDGLCWHDRITKTYIAPQSVKTPPARSA
jgi:uncharacterized RDD family membrane protein YckC